MVNKALRIVLYTIFTISLLFVVPFNNIYADTITSSNINGISITLDEVTFIEYKQFNIDGVNTNVARNYYNYIAEIQFDKSYLGNININMQYSYQARNDTGMATYNGTKLQKVFVNGDKAYMSFGFFANSNTDPFWYNSVTYSLTNSDVIEYGLISDIQQIVSILEENQDIINDIYSELQTVVDNTELANTYLEDISKIRRFDIPFESLIYNLYLITNYEQYLYYDSSIYFQYPVYKFTNAKRVLQQYTDANVEYDWIFVTDCSQPALLRNYMNITNANASVTFKEFHNLGNVPNIGYVYYYHAILKSTTNANTLIDIDFSQTSPNLYVGVLLNKVGYKNYSTDFALQNGLSNDLLDNIQLIANGTNESSAASSQSDLANTQLQQDSNTLFTQEDSFKQDMNSAMQNIDTTFSLNNFGSSFMTSAQWVRMQYETLTNNTPFASLITFSLLVGLALIVIGKVYK